MISSCIINLKHDKIMNLRVINGHVRNAEAIKSFLLKRKKANCQEQNKI